MTREFAHHLGLRMNASFIVDEKPGASGGIAAQSVISARADGLTLLVGTIGQLSINKHLYSKLSYDTDSQLIPIIQIMSVPNLLLVPASFPASNLAEFITYAKKHGSSMNYGSTGVGTSLHMCAELLKQRAHVDSLHTPFKTGGEALTDLVAGRIHFLFFSPIGASALVKDGKLKAIAITSKERDPLWPNVPTFEEVGIKDFVVEAWVGLLAPAGTSNEIVSILNKESNAVLQMPEMRQRLQAQGARPVGGSTAQFAAHIKSESERWGSVIRSAQIKVE